MKTIEFRNEEIKIIRLAVSNLSYEYEKTLDVLKGKEPYQSVGIKMIQDCKNIIEKLK